MSRYIYGTSITRFTMSGCCLWCYLEMLTSCSLLSEFLCDVGLHALPINLQKRGSDPLAEICSACNSEWINVIIVGSALENRVYAEKGHQYTSFPAPFLLLVIGSTFPIL